MTHPSLHFLRMLVRPMPTEHLVPLSGRARGAAFGFRTMAVLRDPLPADNPGQKAAAPAVMPDIRASRKPPLAVSAPAARVAPAAPGNRLMLSGRFSDVCAELERLVAQEERYLQAG